MLMAPDAACGHDSSAYWTALVTGTTRRIGQAITRGLLYAAGFEVRRRADFE
jgi:hypothetical protein